MNPWWEGKPARVLPKFRRWAFARTLRSLEIGPAPITVLRGPRQVGKSTIQDQIIEHLLSVRGVAPTRVLKVQFDEVRPLGRLQTPIFTLTRWFENRVLARTFNEAARAGEPAYLFFDEVQNLEDWAPELKSLVDIHTVRVLVTGSSALRIQAGNDSLSGRITPVELGPLRLSEVSSLRYGEDLAPLLTENGPDPLADPQTWRSLAAHGLKHLHARDRAFEAWSARGGYPRAHERADVAWPEIASFLVESVVNRAIQHDLRRGERGRRRDESLLKEVFKLACRYAGQTPGREVFVDDVRSALNANIGWQRLESYMRFLENAMLIRLISPLELRLKRRRGPSKICLCDHGIRAAWLQEVIPLSEEALAKSPHLADLAGHIAESAVGYYLGGVTHLDVAHFPQRGAEPEVDFVLTVGDKRVPVEVKYRRRVHPHDDTRGLRMFIEKAAYNAPFGVLVTQHDEVRVDDPRIVALPLSSLLLLR